MDTSLYINGTHDTIKLDAECVDLQYYYLQKLVAMQKIWNLGTIVV